LAAKIKTVWLDYCSTQRYK